MRSCPSYSLFRSGTRHPKVKTAAFHNICVIGKQMFRKHDFTTFQALLSTLPPFDIALAAYDEKCKRMRFVRGRNAKEHHCKLHVQDTKMIVMEWIFEE